MPVWHETIKKLAPENLAVLGVVQEQHAERTKLYKQWKQYDFSIAQDPFTKLGLAVVPIFIGIDEHGIVQSTRLRPDKLKEFLEMDFEEPEFDVLKRNRETDYAKLAAEDPSVENLCMLGDQVLLFGSAGKNSCDKAIASYQSALEKDPDNGAVMFRLGAAYRKRYDEHSNDDADFDQASRYWTMALASNPRQYIWRRRIEQYGPRLQKPYPFYDWVNTAIKEIKDRGETPVELKVKLTQSELAGRSASNFSEVEVKKPKGVAEIERDKGKFISIESTMVPGFAKVSKPATVHMRLLPVGAKWNNESTPLRVWLESDSVKLSKQLFEFQNPLEADSNETRSLEFDLIVTKSGDRHIKGFALYNVCADNGVCMFRRQDFVIEVPQ